MIYIYVSCMLQTSDHFFLENMRNITYHAATWHCSLHHLDVWPWHYSLKPNVKPNPTFQSSIWMAEKMAPATGFRANHKPSAKSCILGEKKGWWEWVESWEWVSLKHTEVGSWSLEKYVKSLSLFYNICIVIVTTASNAFDRNFPFCDSFKVPSWYWIPSLRKFSGWVAGQEYLKVRNCNEVQLDFAHRKGVDENRKLIGDFITPLGLLKVSDFGLSNWKLLLSPDYLLCLRCPISVLASMFQLVLFPRNHLFSHNGRTTKKQTQTTLGAIMSKKYGKKQHRSSGRSIL